MNDNTVLRIKVPAHLYESVKKQLTLKESKKKLSEAISGTDEELMAFYEKVKEQVDGGTDIESAVQYAKFDIENPDAAKELSSPMNEVAKGKAYYGAGMEVVKEKKMKTPKDGMHKVEEVKEEMPAKKRSLEELVKAKEKLEKKINEMGSAYKVEEKEKVDEVGAGVEYAWIPGAIGAGLIAANVVKAVRQHMKEKNLTGLKGFWQAYQEVGADAKDVIGKKMSGGMEEAKDKEKKEEDK